MTVQLRLSGNIGRRGFLAGIGAGAALIGGLGRKAAAADIEIRMGTTDTEEQVKNGNQTGIFHLKELVEGNSNSDVAIEIFEGGSLGGQREIIEKVQTGIIEAAGGVSTSNFSSFVPEYGLLDLPYLIPSIDKYSEIARSDFGLSGPLVQAAQGKGLHVLMTVPFDFRWLLIAKKAGRPVRTVSDANNLKLRTSASAVEQRVVELMGANPTPVGWLEVYGALEQGVVDGLQAPPLSAYLQKHHETLLAITNLRHLQVPQATVFNLDWFESQPEDVKTLLTEAAVETMAWQVPEIKRLNGQVLGKIEEAGVEVVQLSDVELADWREQIGHQRPEWESMIDGWGRDVYEAIVAAVG